MQPKVTIFGPIDDLTVESVQMQLELRDQNERLIVELNSDGGSVQEGITVYNLLRQWPGGVTTEVAGWACSIASLIAMAGDVRRAHENALIMIHSPWTNTSGNAAELRTKADLLERVSQTMLAAYSRSGQSERLISEWLAGDRDFWFNAAEAKLLGLITEVIADDARTGATLANAQASRLRIPPVFLMAQLQRTSMPNANTLPNPNQPDVEAIRAAAVQAEGRRRTTIAVKFARFQNTAGVPELLAACQNDTGCSIESASEKLLAKLGEGSFSISGRHTPSMDGDRVEDFKAAAQDALLARGGIKVAEPHPGARDLRRVGIVGIAESLLSMTGQMPADRSPSGIIHAALSTSDFPSLLGGIANKALAMGYTNQSSNHRKFTGEREVTDFKLQTLVNLSEAPGLERVAELSEYRNGALYDGASTFQVETFGKIIGLSRQAMINDDVGAFSRLPVLFGAAAARLEADKVFSVLTANATLQDGYALFSTQHSNLAGVAAALSVASLGAARAAMRKQKGLAGLDFIDAVPRVLIVPVALETTAEQLIATLNDPSRNNDTTNLEFIRGLTLVADPRLDVDSAVSWYLSTDPSQLESILRVYLAGENRPHLEEVVNFRTDAIDFKTRLDFATGVVDYRGMYKNPGA